MINKTKKTYAEWQGSYLWIWNLDIDKEKDIWVGECTDTQKEKIMKSEYKEKLLGYLLISKKIYIIDFS